MNINAPYLFFIVLITGLYISISTSVLAQEGISRVSSLIVDNSNGKPIPYATVFNLSNRKGTVSNLNGEFILEKVKIQDTISISVIGYKTQRFVLNKLDFPEVIRMIPRIEMLNEAVIFGDNSYLYRLVAQAQKTRSKRTLQAKTYFLLESFINDEQVELVESYYNGSYTGYNVHELELKNGRLALQKFSNRFFQSTETSIAIQKHNLFTDSDLFPENPLQFSKKQLQKNYELRLAKRYKNDENHTIYVIECIPKQMINTQFESKLWLDSLNGDLLKTELTIDNAKVHPFATTGNASKIEHAKLRISKSFQSLATQRFVKSIDFGYDLTYLTNDSIEINVKSQAVLYAYNYDTTFQLPQFEFHEGMYKDYKQINASPYNEFFWNNIDEFGLSIDKSKIEQFVRHKATIDNQTLFLKNPYFKKYGNFEFPYVYWNKKRIQFRASSSEQKTDYSKYNGMLPSERYSLEVQLYMDVNKLNDSIHVITKTIFDPYESFYHFESTPEGNAFINMYFDIVEISRRKMMQEIESLSIRSNQSVQLIYEKHTAELESIQATFLKEVDRGTKESAMQYWNQYIIEHLEIDNITLFGLFETP